MTGITNLDIVGLTLIPTASLPAAAASNEGAIAYDSTTNTLKFSDGASWANVGIAGGIGSLDDSYNSGATITVDAGPVILASNQAAGNALNVTEANVAGTGNLIDLANSGTGKDIDGTASTWYISSAGAITAASLTATTATLTNATITSLTLGSVDGFTLSGNCTFTSSATTGDGLLLDGSTVTSGNILRIEADAATLNGGNILVCTVDTVAVFDIDEDGSTTIAGTASSDALTLTAGDITLSSGTVNITANAGDAIDMVPVADGAALDLNLPAAYNLATGAIDIDGSTGSGPVIDIAFSGAYTGNAANLNMTNAVGASALALTGAGVRTVSLVSITDTPSTSATFDLNVTPAGGAANANVLDIDIAGTGSANVIDIDFAAAYTGDAVSINMTNAVDASALDLTGAGTRTVPLITITDVPTTSAPSIDLNITPGAGVQSGIDIDVAGTQTADVISIDCSAAFDGDLINLTTTNMGAAGQAIVVDGSIAASGAIVNLSTSGILTANGSVLTATASTQPGAANVGTAARFLDTGAAQATTYAVQIDSTNNEALNVSTGKAHFAEAVTFRSSNVEYTPANYVQAGGAANAITVSAITDDTGSTVSLADGLKIIVDLNTRSLQAGANTLDYAAGGAVSITRATDPAANLTTAYAANGVVELIYSADATAWLCMAQ